MAKINQNAPEQELLNASQAGAMYGISERMFHDLRRRGVVPAPIVLGPRLLRWSRKELEAAIEKLPRASAHAAEPEQLQKGKAKKSRV